MLTLLRFSNRLSLSVYYVGSMKMETLILYSRIRDSDVVNSFVLGSNVKMVRMALDCSAVELATLPAETFDKSMLQ